jgi:hypothetical protein
MELRKRLWGAIGGLAVMAGGTWTDDSRSFLTNPVVAAEPNSSDNYRIAQAVANAIAQSAPEQGYSATVECQNGVVTLHGTAASTDQAIRMLSAAQATPSVERVVNALVVSDSNPLQPVMYIRQTAAPQEGGAGPGEAPQQLAPAAPQHVFRGTAATQYDYPYMPPFAWPAYAPYPNYSAAQYPTCYSNKAWPNIGPFTPYPEPPLDWRQVKLKWDDGHWYLRFKSPCACSSCFQCPIGFGKSDCGWEVQFKKPWHTHRYPN